MRADLDEPVRRYLTHALGDGDGGGSAVRLTMAGRVDAGRRLDFTADEDLGPDGFTWRCRAGWGRVKPFRVVDRYAAGAGSTQVRCLGVPLLHQDGEDTARSAAGRFAAERIWAPGTLVDVPWRAEDEHTIVATLDVPPERPELTLTIDARGALQRVRLLRWGNVGRPAYEHIPFGAEVHAEAGFGALTLPSRVSVAWEPGAPAERAFFTAEIRSAVPR